MSSGKKLILVILDLLLLSLAVPAAWDYYNILEYGWGMNASSQLPYIGEYVSPYLFWGNTVLVALLILALLVIVAYPQTYIEITLPTKGGKLTLKRSAIEGFVREKVLENDYLKSPRIRVILHKNKIHIHVRGEIIPRVEIVEKTQLLQEEILDGLKQFFGVEQYTKVKVEVDAINKETSMKNSRVI